MTPAPLGLEGRRIANADVVADHDGQPTSLSLAFEDGHTVTLTMRPDRSGVYMEVDSPPPYGAQPAARWAPGLRPGAEILRVEPLQHPDRDEDPWGMRLDLAEERTAFVYAFGDALTVTDEPPDSAKDDLRPAIVFTRVWQAIAFVATAVLVAVFILVDDSDSFIDAAIYVCVGLIVLFSVGWLVIVGRLVWGRTRASRRAP